MTPDFGPMDTQVAQSQSAAPNDLSLRVQVTQLQAEVANLTQQIRDKPQKDGGGADQSAGLLALVDIARELRDGVNELKSQLNAIEEAIRSQ